MTLLSVQDVSVRFGGVKALDGVTFEVAEGQLFGLIGPNGAGKTTLIEAVSGFLPQATGSVDFAGRPLTGLPVYRRAQLGLVRTFQAIELFDDLTVRENLVAAAHRRTWWQSLADMVLPRRDRQVAVVDDVLDLLELGAVGHLHPPQLSQGQRKLAGVARALACSPRLVMLDEPAAGLDSDESLALGERLRAVVTSGVTVLLVDHDMGLVLGTCDRLVVLDFGKVLASGTPAQIRSDRRVIDAYLGDDVLAEREQP
jgi:ABC-type branched-subunit amino acid transport system ATPase component